MLCKIFHYEYFEDSGVIYAIGELKYRTGTLPVSSWLKFGIVVRADNNNNDQPHSPIFQKRFCKSPEVLFVMVRAFDADEPNTDFDNVCFFFPHSFKTKLHRLYIWFIQRRIKCTRFNFHFFFFWVNFLYMIFWSLNLF